MANQDRSIDNGHGQFVRVVVNQEDHGQSILTQGFNVTFGHGCGEFTMVVVCFVKRWIQFYSCLLQIWENLNGFWKLESMENTVRMCQTLISFGYDVLSFTCDVLIIDGWIMVFGTG